MNPGIFPMPPDEIFIERSPVNVFTLLPGLGLQWVELYFEIPDYNPEWVSVDIWGENIIIEQAPISPPAWSQLLPWWNPLMPGGIIVHECLPKAGTFLDPIDFDDNCEVAYVINNYTGTSTLNGATFPVGNTTVIWTVFDEVGNSASCQYNIVVVDNEPPTIICAANQTQTADPGVCNAAVTVVGPTTGDNCGVQSLINDYNGTTNASGTYPVGTTPVLWTVTDIHGNTNTCTQNITVTDDEDPTITCPANVTVAMNTGCTATGVNLGTPVTADNCGVNPATNDAVEPYLEGTTIVTWTVVDIHGNSATCTQNITVVRNNISGNLTYHNGGQTLGNVIITLDDGVNPPQTSTTVAGTGAYGFNNLCAGTYTLSANFGSKPVGGINATDAAQVNYWGVAPWQIEKVRFYAGDAALNNYLDATDAGRILSYFVTAGNPAMSTPWKFWVAGETISANPVTPPVGLQIPSITIGGGDATINLLGQVTGDFNMSYSSATKSGSETLTLNTGKNILAEVGTELELPIVTGIDMDLGAISLILDFPADKLEISEVFLTSNPTSPLMYNINGDELRIGWNSLVPVYLNEGESMITLKMKVIAEAGLEGMSLSLVADPLNELADGNFLVINDAVLEVDVIHTSALGMIQNNQSDNLELANHPNPFNGTTNFVYSLPVDGKVILEIYDLLGNKVKVAVDENQTAGEYTLKLNANSLQPGVYTATLKLKNESTFITRTIKIISR
jgi:hypothetical protein